MEYLEYFKKDFVYKDLSKKHIQRDSLGDMIDWENVFDLNEKDEFEDVVDNKNKDIPVAPSWGLGSKALYNAR